MTNLLRLNIQYFAQTKAADLINPEVLEDAIAGQLENGIRFAPYARIDNTLEGQPGDTITRPRYAYTGAAEDLVEGVPMDPAKLSMTTTQVTIKEAGKALEVTEKAIITNVSGTMDEAGNQIALSLADKMEIDYLASLGQTALTFNGTATSADSIIDAVDVFNDEDEGNYILFVNNKDYTKLVKSLFNVGGDVQHTALTKAQVSELVGVKDIVKTRRLPEGTSYLQKQGAVEIVYKKRPQVNSGHDILARTFVLAGNQYYTTNLYDESGVVKIEATV
jgi:hypothetical protein